MSNYQPQNPLGQPQMQPVMMPNSWQQYGANPYQVMDNPGQYVQYNQWNMHGQPVQNTPAPAQEGFLDKMIKWVVGFIAKLSWQPDPKTWAWKPVWLSWQSVQQYQPVLWQEQYIQQPNQIPAQQYQQVPWQEQYAQQLNQVPVPVQQYQQVPAQQQSWWVVWGFFQWVGNIAQNVWNIWWQIYHWVESWVQQVWAVWWQVVNTWKDLYQWAKETVQEVKQIPQQVTQQPQTQESESVDTITQVPSIENSTVQPVQPPQVQ